MRSSCFFLLSMIFGTVALAEPDGGRDLLKRGDPLSSANVQSVEYCVENSAQLNGQTVKVEGMVKTVCQKKGCWFVLEGKNGDQIRITAMGYKFFVPKDSSGMSAVIEGQFAYKEINAKLAQHYEDDRVTGTAEKPHKVTESVKEFSIAATAVELSR